MTDIRAENDSLKADKEPEPTKVEPTGEEWERAACRLNRAFARLSDGSEVDRLRAELDELRGEVREWLCAKCNMVYPGPPGKGVSGTLCSTCGGLTGPRNGTELRRARAREKRLREHLEKARSLMRDSGANEREYIVYATLSAGLDPLEEP